MRTTLEIDNDVLQAASERARREKRTVGDISDLARRSLTLPAEAPKSIYGLRPFPKRCVIVTNEMINMLGEGDFA
jgi:hypothetical protein